MAVRPVAAMTDAVAVQILRDAHREWASSPADVASHLAVQLADEILARGGWKANTCRPLLRAYELSRGAAP
jgi:CRP-like cAMP-binding protein